MTVKKSKHYEVKRIFIGSPGDVPKERKIFSDIIKRVNKIKANSLSVHLEAIGWEDTLPGKGRPRPQSNINEDLLKCHLIIMLLWNRWGTNNKLIRHDRLWFFIRYGKIISIQIEN